MTKVKICGITNLEDALVSAKFGADALGFNFYAKSPRYIAPKKAREIIEHLPENILKVGVFVNESLEKIVEIASIAKLDALQLHGEETPEFARALKAQTNLEIIKAFRVSPEFKPEDVLPFATGAILLDAYNPKEHGGTGETFDWKIAFKVNQLVPKLYLAGGLDSKNVDNAIRRVQPFSVDSCSLLEEEKGKKDKKKVVQFIQVSKKDQKIETKDIYDLLFQIDLRPVMYFGRKSLTDLQNFMFGFEMALHLTKSDFNFCKYESDEYKKWMSEKIGFGYPNTIDCMTHILRKFDQDEVKAFDYFFTLLNEFWLEKEKLTN